MPFTYPKIEAISFAADEMILAFFVAVEDGCLLFMHWIFFLDQSDETKFRPDMGNFQGNYRDLPQTVK